LRPDIVSDWLLAHPTGLQSYLLIGTFGFVAIVESLSPARPLRASFGVRWFNQLALTTVGYGLVRLCIPLAVLATAMLAEREGWGLLNRVDLPPWLALVAGLLVMDLAGYAEHRLFHGIPLLWRVHQVHHSDLDVDCGTALRHHPIEILLTSAFDVALIVAAGVPPLAVIVAVTLTGMANVFNHGNVALPLAADRLLRKIVVTPDMHRIHHSTCVSESNRNFSMLLPWWDHVFSTYAGEPQLGHQRMELGLAEAPSESDVTLWRLLAMPFRGSGVATVSESKFDQR
jgi:sterol desaturase/sphingolipid hydroxylase (fatty acid hydroxylase superfamily)